MLGPPVRGKKMRSGDRDSRVGAGDESSCEVVTGASHSQCPVRMPYASGPHCRRLQLTCVASLCAFRCPCCTDERRVVPLDNGVEGLTVATALQQKPFEVVSWGGGAGRGCVRVKAG